MPYNSRADVVLFCLLAQSAEVVEYAECISSERKDPTPCQQVSNDTKQFNGEASVMLELWEMLCTFFIAVALSSSLVRRGSTW